MLKLVGEKVDQAVQILDELSIDAWLTFVRETTETGDPILPIILGQSLTWQSALLITRSGERVAIVGNYEADAVKSLGVWTQVIPYVEGVRAPLLETLERLKPGRIAINFSRDDVKADGLSQGMFLLLQDYLSGTPFADRLISADSVIGALRGRKTAGEVDRLRAAITTTDEIFDAVVRHVRPGRTEREVAAFMHNEVERRKLGLAWDRSQCPIVNTGPDSMIGHGIPSDLKIEPGHILHIDFGIRQDEYCSDLQRCWYVPEPGQTEPPEPVLRALATVVKAIHTAGNVLKPSVECREVDAAARQIVTAAGYPEYQHATGHQIGRSAHDGGGVLGPRWERYGRTPYRKVEAGNVFTLELGVENVDGRGYLGLEEMVLVTGNGCEFLSRPQTTLSTLA